MEVRPTALENSGSTARPTAPAASAHWCLRCSVGQTMVTVSTERSPSSSAATRSANAVLPAPGVATARKSRGRSVRYRVSARRCHVRSGRVPAGSAPLARVLKGPPGRDVGRGDGQRPYSPPSSPLRSLSKISLHSGHTGDPGFADFVTGNVSPQSATTIDPVTADSTTLFFRT